MTRRGRSLTIALLCATGALILLSAWDIPSEPILIGLASGGVALGFTACLLALGEGWW